MPLYPDSGPAMGEFAPLRTGQLVVRFRTPPRLKLIWACAAIVALVAIGFAYEFGRYRGGFDHLKAVQHEQSFDAQLSNLRRQNKDLQAQATAAEMARRVDHEAYGNVEKSLGELQSQVAKQREELAFYRGIVAPEDGVGALKVQRLEVLAGAAESQFHLRVVLVQPMRQDGNAAGTLEIEVLGTRHGAAAHLTLAELTNAQGAAHPAFSFRYFQNVEEDIVLPPDFEPASVDVEVKPAHQNAIKQSFPWQVRAQE
jgi:hypothetical protein